MPPGGAHPGADVQWTCGPAYGKNGTFSTCLYAVVAEWAEGAAEWAERAIARDLT